MAVSFTLQQHDILWVWYLNQYQDFIKEVNINAVDGIEINSDGGDEYSFNFEEIQISGVELSWSWQVLERLRFNSSLSYLLEASENPGSLDHTIISPSAINTEKTDLLFLSDLTASL
ncbi:MAG: hypothetical protein HRU20_28475 [Pseudomonadales bacterium]|nr:hypothetical protein [Pseudomonadales bacterium]